MKQFIFSLFFALSLSALEIVETVGTSSGESYLILTLENMSEFSCKTTKTTANQAGHMSCEFTNIPAVKPIASKNNFFEIEPVLGKESFAIRIDFKKNALVYSIDKNTLSNKPLLPDSQKQSSKKWIVVGYDKTPPILQTSSAKGLGFAIDYPNFALPSVGALDSTGKLVDPAGKSFGAFFETALEQFSAKEYAQALKTINESVEIEPSKNIFLPELLAVKIKILDKLGRNEKEIIDIARAWTSAYTLHSEMPEILLILARAQMRLGQSSEALYNYNTIIREYPESRFADLAKVYRADRYLTEGKVDEASIWYERVLFSTKDIEAASLAAANLAEIAIKKDEFEKAISYYDKVIQSNPDFFKTDLARSEELLYQMVDHKIYSSAAKLGGILLEFKEPKTEAEEKFLLQLARWQNFAGDGAKSLESYNHYIENFPYSKSKHLAEKERDILMLDLELDDDENNLILYDRIISNYPKDESASRALYAKTKLLLKHGRYIEVKELLARLDHIDSSLFQDYDQLIRQIERTLLNSFILNGECKEAVDLVSDRNLGISLRKDLPFYECAYKERDYKLALEIAEYNQQKTSKIKAVEWIERELDSLYAMGNYALFSDKTESYLRMQRAFYMPVEIERYIQLFNTYYRLGEKPSRLEEIVKTVEYNFPKDPRIMDLYFSIIHQAQKMGNDEQVYTYSKKLINRHRTLSARSFSPESELFFAASAKKLNKLDEAELVLSSIDLSGIKKEERARVLFMLAELQEAKKPELAMQTYKECKELGLADNPWVKLCESKAL